MPEVRIAAELLASYPDAKVDLTMGERTIDLIDEGFDLAIRLALPPDSSLIVRSLATWRHVLCCSPAYLEKYGPPQQLSELAERNCVRHLFYPHGDDWHFVDRKGAPASVRVSGNLVTNSDGADSRFARCWYFAGGGIFGRRGSRTGPSGSSIVPIPAGGILDERGLSASSSFVGEGPQLYRSARAPQSRASTPDRSIFLSLARP